MPPLGGGAARRVNGILRKGRAFPHIERRSRAGKFSQKQIKLEMSHRVRGHQKLEPVETRDQMFVNILVPDALLVREILVNMFDDRREKCSGSGRGIEYLHPMNFLLPLFALHIDSYPGLARV